MSQNYPPGPGDNSKRERESTMVGWTPGQYAKSSKGEETKRVVIVVAIGLLFLCIVIALAVGAYLYI